MLVFARDTASAYSVTSGFNGYGIPYQLIIVPQDGIVLPTLNSSTTSGNYGGIVVLSEVSYDYLTTTATQPVVGWQSAITVAQWQQMYDYQIAFGVRMVRLDVFPTAAFGVTTTISGAGCCGTGVEQFVSISNDTAFSTANLITGATMSTIGLWHYPATITNSSMATEIAQFGPSTDGTFTGTSTAAVINNIGGQQQMVWFTSWATDWNPTSNFLQHSYIHWLTRGLYVGRRRIYFNTQIDDMHLETDLYSPNGTTFRVRAEDLAAHVTWQANLNARLPPGSSYIVEIGHNGNGDIENSTNNDVTSCVPANGIEYPDQIDTALEFQKPIGSGVDIWPVTPTNYTWTLTCALEDPLLSWFHVPANLNSFMHISHTFSHEALDNATYSDANKEIYFNVAWLKQVGIYNANHFSASGLIPPAITGLHNGDVIQAWMDNGIIHVVGDNTRPVLLNTQNEFWPLISNVANNGYAGLTIMPRWATTIYYNCDLPACTLAEWIATSAGHGNFSYDLLNDARTTNTRHLLGLHHDAFMFHQANLRAIDVPVSTVGAQTGQLSLLMIWVETVLQEFTRLVTWPIISIKHDDAATQFLNRMTLDQCNPNLTYEYSADGLSIIGAVLTATGNTCSVPVPITFPVTATTGYTQVTSEQIGTDTPTYWVTLTGSPVNFTMSAPVSVF